MEAGKVVTQADPMGVVTGAKEEEVGNSLGKGGTPGAGRGRHHVEAVEVSGEACVANPETHQGSIKTAVRGARPRRGPGGVPKLPQVRPTERPLEIRLPGAKEVAAEER